MARAPTARKATSPLPPEALPAPAQALTVLDTHFGDGSALLRRWHTHSLPLQPPSPIQALHYVAVLTPQDAQALQSAHPGGVDRAAITGVQDLGQTLRALCFGLVPGMHRLVLQPGRLQLTLYVGTLADALAELQMQADEVWLHQPDPLDKWRLKAIARLCRRGAQLHLVPRPSATAAPVDTSPASTQVPAPALAALLQQAGFDAATRRYAPAWALRRAPAAAAAAVRRVSCAVLGAGLAGASVAYALALRGHEVLVLDGADGAAAHASGLPAGLLVPHVSADDDPRSRLTRAGTRLMLQHAQHLLELGQDWAPTGVEQRYVSAAWRGDAQALGWAHAAHGADGAETMSIWHPHAAWIKPARLVQRWLQQPGVRFQGNSPVRSVQREGPDWVLYGAQQEVLARAEHLILANALGAATLLAAPHWRDQLWPGLHAALLGLQGVPGTLSYGMRTAAAADGALGPGGASVQALFPDHPVNGAGSLIPDVPMAQGRHWFAGASFEPAAPAGQAPKTYGAQELQHWQAHNLGQLQRLAPRLAHALAPSWHSAQIASWHGTRCVAHDRMPLLGPMQAGPAPTLWISAAMGARGLSLAALCAEILVAQLCDEPLPIEASLLKALHCQRSARWTSASTRAPAARLDAE